MTKKNTQIHGETSPKKHACISSAIPSEVIQEVFANIMQAFKPMRVKYKNTNPHYTVSEKSTGSETKYTWKSSCWMEVDEHMGGGMQKKIKPDPAMLEVTQKLLSTCDKVFRKWYEDLHGQSSIYELKRLQSFITRYRPYKNEDGLLRHIDGAQVDGSVILGLPTTDPFEGGGVTVWEGTPGVDEKSWSYPILPGDICCLDNFVFHQGNPITKGERWSLVIFYRTQKIEEHFSRWSRVLKNFGRQFKIRQNHLDKCSAPHEGNPQKILPPSVPAVKSKGNIDEGNEGEKKLPKISRPLRLSMIEESFMEIINGCEKVSHFRLVALTCRKLKTLMETLPGSMELKEVVNKLIQSGVIVKDGHTYIVCKNNQS